MKTIMIADLRAHISRLFDVPLDKLLSRSRKKGYAEARHAGYFLARELTDKSLPEIGRYMGGRDHSTVISGIARCRELMRRDPIYKAKIRRVRKLVTRQGRPLTAKPALPPPPAEEPKPWGFQIEFRPKPKDELDELSKAVAEHYGREWQPEPVYVP